MAFGWGLGNCETLVVDARIAGLLVSVAINVSVSGSGLKNLETASRPTNAATL